MSKEQESAPTELGARRTSPGGYILRVDDELSGLVHDGSKLANEARLDNDGTFADENVA